jgi:hypothetical protein
LADAGEVQKFREDFTLLLPVGESSDYNCFVRLTSSLFLSQGRSPFVGGGSRGSEAIRRFVLLQIEEKLEMICRCRWFALALLLFGLAEGSRAEIYTMYTNPSPGGPAVQSTLGVTITALGGAFVAPIPATALTGRAIVDMNLDSTDSGVLYVKSSRFSLANSSGNLSTVLGNVSYSLQNVSVSIDFGPIPVTNGSFSLDSNSVGRFSLSSGLVLLSTPLGIFNLNFNQDPLPLDLRNLSSGVSVAGRADDSFSRGADTSSSDPHSAGEAGLTGLSGIDDDGSEIFVNLASMSIATSIAGLPATISLTGSGLYVGVPEASTFLMMGMACLVGGLQVVRRRRNG